MWDSGIGREADVFTFVQREVEEVEQQLLM